MAHDPTQRNRQGPDVGTQYRSAVFYSSPAQQQAVQAYVAALTKKKVYSQPIVTEVAPLSIFYPAESYHQGYLARHPDQPYIVINDMPKLENLRRTFPALYRETPVDVAAQRDRGEVVHRAEGPEHLAVVRVHV